MPPDAELPARDYVATVLAGIGGETDIGVVQSLLRQVQAALTQFAGPSWAPPGRAPLAGSPGLAGSGGETDIGVVQSLLRQVQAALTQFADPSWAPTGRAQLAEAAMQA